MNPCPKKRVSLLVGSPKRKNSASATLGLYLCSQLDSQKFDYQEIHLRSVLSDKQNIHVSHWLNDILKSDVLIFSSPLYVDCLPSYVFQVFEKIYRERKKTRIPKEIQFLAIINSGFPESSQSQTALDICRHFARESGMLWLGGLLLGTGFIVGGRDIRKMRWLFKNIKKSLDLSATAMNYGKIIPVEAFQIMGKPVFGKKLFCWLGNIGFKLMAKRNGTAQQLYDRPYEKEQMI